MSLTDRRQLAWFIIVGGCGFAVDATLLQTLIYVGLGPVTARLLSFPGAVLTTWLLHRRFTFAARRSEQRRAELSKYLTSQVVSAVAGLTIYTWLVLCYDIFAAWPLAALVVSAAVSTVCNYLFSHYLVFTGSTER